MTTAIYENVYRLGEDILERIQSFHPSSSNNSYSLKEDVLKKIKSVFASYKKIGNDLPTTAALFDLTRSSINFMGLKEVEKLTFALGAASSIINAVQLKNILTKKDRTSLEKISAFVLTLSSTILFASSPVFHHVINLGNRSIYSISLKDVLEGVKIVSAIVTYSLRIYRIVREKIHLIADQTTKSAYNLFILHANKEREDKIAYQIKCALIDTELKKEELSIKKIGEILNKPCSIEKIGEILNKPCYEYTERYAEQSIPESTPYKFALISAVTGLAAVILPLLFVPRNANTWNALEIIENTSSLIHFVKI